MFGTGLTPPHLWKFQYFFLTLPLGFCTFFYAASGLCCAQLRVPTIRTASGRQLSKMCYFPTFYPDVTATMVVEWKQNKINTGNLKLEYY